MTTRTRTGWRMASLIVAMLAVAGARAAGPRYVASTGDGSDGLSWSTAWTNVQHALDAAQPGDTIYLKGETFSLPTNSVNGRLVWTQSDVSVIGGYAADGGSPGARTNTPTVLSRAGGLANRILWIANVTNARLERVTLTGGSLTASTGYGAGLYAAGCSNLVLSAVVVEKNSFDNGASGTVAEGGGLYATNCWGTAMNCQFQANSHRVGYLGFSRGVGVCLQGGEWTLRDCIIRNNLEFGASGYGHTRHGAGVFVHGGAHTLINCLVSRNFFDTAGINVPTGVIPAGDAVYVGAGDVQIANSTFYWHRYEGIRNAGGTVLLRDSIVWDCGDDIVGSVTLQNNCIEDGDGNGANGNISSDPKFVRGLYLASDSPCVDAGSQTAETAGLGGYTTQTNGAGDSGMVDLGYHFSAGVMDYHVSVSAGDDANTGASSGAAFKTITRALQSVRDGGHIFVTAGDYTSATEVFPLTLANYTGVRLMGADAATTVINAAGTAKTALIVKGIYPDAGVANLTLTGALVPSGSPRYGGGLFLEHVRGSVSFCTVTNNTFPHPGNVASYGAGAGVYANWCDVAFSDCLVSGNLLSDGYGNGIHQYGGGVYAKGSGSFLRCRIVGNVVESGNQYWVSSAYGGGLYLDGAFTIRNSLIATNDARVRTASNAATVAQGDGVFLQSGALRIESCTLADNPGEGLRRVAGTVAVTNSIIWNNGVDVTGVVSVAWSDVGVADPAATRVDCISADPLFVGAAAGNYRLRVRGGALSPAVNAGNPVADGWMLTGADLDGNPRIQNKRVDMGAYENLTPPSGTLIFLQ